MVQIKNITTCLTCPHENLNINLVVVRIDTDQPGLYGLGCATFTQRCRMVTVAIEEYLKPLLLGRNVEEIQELWSLVNQNAYWRNGPAMNSALGGIDTALWDIKGKMAGMPVYQLLGGKCREGLAAYSYAQADSQEEILDEAQRLWEEGCRHIRLQYNHTGRHPETAGVRRPENAKPGFYLDHRQYVRQTVRLLETVRDRMGPEPEFIHDVHQRITPADALYLATALEPVRMYFLEDPLPPDQTEHLRQIRERCSTPIALGELFTNPVEWTGLVTERLIDFMRIHITMIGGVTPALRCAHLCELFGVRTAWHGPWDMNPIGHAAQMHIDLASPNFAVKEWSGFSRATCDIFPGTPELRRGYAYVNDKPGFGVEFDEELAKRFPPKPEDSPWTQSRQSDGSLFLP